MPGPSSQATALFSGTFDAGPAMLPTDTLPWSIASGQLMFNYLAQSPYIEFADSLRRMTFYNFILRRYADSNRQLRTATGPKRLEPRQRSRQHSTERKLGFSADRHDTYPPLFRRSNALMSSASGATRRFASR